ncbi:MAG TPA: VIT domain-containing protein [Methylomirabilota bacterium]|nr:VIT domain-containing protein [Methylomirabilota bacterium]
MKRIGILFLVWLALAPAGGAVGLIVMAEPEDRSRPLPPERIVPPPRPPPPWMPRPWAPIEVASTRATARIRDQIATTTVAQEFYNPNARPLEGTFLFPVPKGAHVDKFTMEIDGKPVEAELLSADKARSIYEDIVRRQNDPALLEYAGRDLFKVRIFPIEPHARKRVTLTYSQLLRSDAGLTTFVLPLNAGKYSARPIRHLSVHLELETSRPLKTIYSPSHAIEIKRPGPARATVDFETRESKPDADLQLFFSQEEGEVGMSLLTHRTGDDAGYFLMLASPGFAAKEAKVVPRDLVFVLDTSGSMAGSKLEQAKKALLFCVENLNAQDRFEILRFSTEVEGLFERLADVNADHRARARSFVQNLKPTGGTAIHDALQRALALRPEKNERPCVIVFLTDGKPTVGITAEDRIVEGVEKANQSGLRIFCFGIGTDVNTHLLDRITETTRAHSTYVLPEEDIEVKVSGFYSKIKEPVLAGLRLTFPEGVRVMQLHPASLPDLFKGDQLVIAGRYSGPGAGAIRLEGVVDGETRSFSFDARFPDRASDHDFIPRLWAVRRVGHLLDEIRLRGENAEIKDEVTELARRYNIVTPYTSYLIVEDEARRRVASSARTLRIEDPAEVNRLADNYRLLRAQKDGDAAVGGARFAQSLKMAAAPDSAVHESLENAQRGLAGASVPANAPATLPGLGVPTRVSSARAPSEPPPSQFVAGRTFYLNDGVWVEAAVQKLDGVRPVRVRFGSRDYFDLLQQYPDIAPCLALGTQVHLVVGATLYEIHE